MNTQAQEVWSTVVAMNRCWTCGDLTQLNKLNVYFHEDMVAITPTDRHRFEGKLACVAGWSGFAQAANILRWDEKDVKIHIYNQTAVVTYEFDMQYKIGTKTVVMAGRDMLILVQLDGVWQIVADQFSPFPA